MFCFKKKKTSFSSTTKDGRSITIELPLIPRKTSKVGLELIKHFEDFRSDAYMCPAGVWTIGYGHTKGVKKGQKISKSKGEVFLKSDILWAENAVKKMVSVKLNQMQFDALVSLVFNIGVGAFKSSTLLSIINKGEYIPVASEFERWVYSDGRVLKGLVRRRRAERNVWNGVVPEEIIDVLKKEEIG